MRSIAALLLAAALATAVTACGGHKPAAPAGILDAPVQKVGLPEVKRDVSQLYRSHPDVRTFVSRSVQYTPKTRDKVISVCSKGGPDVSLRELESSRVLACAPLIFFFYDYGRRSSVPDAVTLSQEIYWYAVSHNRRPYNAQPVLTSLLRTWGVK